MDLLKSMAMDSSMPKWGCRKKCTPRLSVVIDEGKLNKNVDDVGQQPKQGDEKEKQPEQLQKRLILRIKQGERATFITNYEKPGPSKPRHQPLPPPLPELVDEDDPDWKETDAKKEESKRRSKRKRKTEEDDKTKNEKEVPRSRPEFLFRLTQEQVAEDFKLFTGRTPSRRSLRQRPNFDVLCPSSSLPRVFTKDRYGLQMI